MSQPIVRLIELAWFHENPLAKGLGRLGFPLSGWVEPRSSRDFLTSALIGRFVLGLPFWDKLTTFWEHHNWEGEYKILFSKKRNHRDIPEGIGPFSVPSVVKNWDREWEKFVENQLQQGKGGDWIEWQWEFLKIQKRSYEPLKQTFIRILQEWYGVTLKEDDLDSKLHFKPFGSFPPVPLHLLGNHYEETTWDKIVSEWISLFPFLSAKSLLPIWVHPGSAGLFSYFLSDKDYGIFVPRERCSGISEAAAFVHELAHLELGLDGAEHTVFFQEKFALEWELKVFRQFRASSLYEHWNLRLPEKNCALISKWLDQEPEELSREEKDLAESMDLFLPFVYYLASQFIMCQTGV